MKNCLLILLFVTIPFFSKAQFTYSGKIDFGNLDFGGRLIRYETDRVNPYFLDQFVDGREINLVNGINIKDRTFVGIGISSLSFKKTRGFSTTLDLEHLFLKTKLSPLFNFRFGRNYLKNESGVPKNAILVGVDVGANYKPFKRFSFYAKTGFFFTHSVGFYTFRGGIRF